MSVETNKAVIRGWYEEVWNQQNLDLMDELYAPRWVGHFPQGLELQGATSHKQLGAAFTTAFPDARYVIEGLLAEGDLVASRYSMRARHQGELRGIAATGREVVQTGINIHRLADGKIVEQWSQYDMLGLLQQLGALAASGEARGGATDPS